MKEKDRLEGRKIVVLLAIIGFILIYGVHILDIKYVDWIKYEGGDLLQSYYGWRFFRNSAWHWPFGLMDGITSEFVSILYIDSVPMFNVLFKLFRVILPAECQFFGIWGIVCFILSSLLGFELVYECTKKKIYSICGSCFFLFNNIMIERLFTHTSLAANWIIILGILLVIKSKKMSLKRRILSWFGIFFLCISINIYYVPIIGVIMSMYCMFYLSSERKWKEIILTVVVSFFSIIVTFYLYGGFYYINISDAAPSGLGYYCSNINSLFNPMETMKYLSGFGRILKTYPLATEGQYEGYAYLGAGLLIMGVFVIAGLFFQDKEYIKSYIKKNRTLIIGGMVCVILLYILSFGTIVSFNSRILFEIPYPQFILKILGIFRSTGRFLWGVWDIYAIVMLFFLFKEYKGKKGMIIVCLCFILQLYDLFGLYENRHNRFTKEYEKYQHLFSSEEWDILVQGKEEIFMFNKEMLELRIFYSAAELALENTISINDFYFSRRNSEVINRAKMEEFNNIQKGKADNKKVYLFDCAEDVKSLFGKLYFYEIDSFLIGIAEPIHSLREISSIEEVVAISDNNISGCINIADIKEIGTYLIEVRGNNIYNITVELEGYEELMISRYDNNNYYFKVIEKNDKDSVLSVNYSENGNISDIKIYSLKSN